MVKHNSIFVCQQCGNESVRWFGKCPFCGEWGSLVETVSQRSITARTGATSKSGSAASKPISLTSVPAKNTKRTASKMSEFDRVLGGGLVLGQVVLIAGEPGIGKSTILLQVAEKLSTPKAAQFLYVSGEESVNQIKIRADRLGIKSKNLQLLEETDVDVVTDTISSFNKGGLKGIVVDSIQTMSTADLSGMAGSVGQVRECAYRLVRVAKSLNIPIFIVGHVTKQGSIAGPSVLMHIVDTVLWFEGDKSLTIRLLRAVKNRFGPTDEVGVFVMEDKGLISVSSPEKLFLSKSSQKSPGSVVASVMEGTRPVLVEIQALVVPSKLAFPRRVAQGISSKRFELLLAVLARQCGLPLYDSDCYINVSGGISIDRDPSADLAICLATASAYLNKSLPTGLIAIGEVGLLGDVREVVAQDKRVREAKRVGYTSYVASSNTKHLRDAVKSYLR